MSTNHWNEKLRSAARSLKAWPPAPAWGRWQVSRERWESGFRDGRWEYMKGLDEAARYSIVIGYCRWFKPGGAILDVGCGEGVLQERLARSDYSRYVGVDISAEAIQRASRKADARTTFVCQDVVTYQPNETFDAIVFNEVLYYLEDPLGVLKKYERYRRPGGIFIISMWVDEKLQFNWQTLEQAYQFVDAVETRNTRTGNAWVCRVWSGSAKDGP